MFKRPFKTYRQLEHADCGITCIRMIARHYGRKISANYLHKISDTSKLGISIKDIVHTCETIGLHARAAKLTAGQLEKAPLPAILYWKQCHFVVLYRIDTKKRRYHIADPAGDKLALSEEEFARNWQAGNERGLIVLVDPTEKLHQHNEGEDMRRTPGLLKLLTDSVRQHRRFFAIVSLLTLVIVCADICTPFIFRSTIDDGIQGRNINLVWLLVMGQFFVFVGNYVANSISDILLTKLGLKISFAMMNDYLNRIVALPMSFFDRKVNSDLIQKIDDQNRLKNFLTGMPDMSVFTVLNFLVFSGILIYFEARIYAIFLFVSALTLLWSVYFKNRRREIDYANFEYSSENRNNLYELVNGMVEIKAHSAQNSRVDKWRTLQTKINGLTVKSAFLNLTQSSGSTLFNRLMDIAITGMCATFVVRGDMTIGVMMTVSYLIGRLSVPLRNIYTSVNVIQDASISYERLDSIVNYETEERNPHPDTATGDIVFSNVSFKYPGSFSPLVLRNLNCTIPVGKTTAIVGASGSGKTTLLKLLLGFYKPTAGTVTVDGLDISTIDTNDWLKSFGVVMQSGYIFSSSILENIALADETPDREKAEQAARLACIDDFIATLPMGYDTRIGASGLDLSGGQKQRLLIARVIYKNPDIIILDEATSSLDANNERRIVENLETFCKGKTVVVAAHRLSTVKNADNILFIHDGTVRESGTHATLVKERGGYFALVQNQLELGA